MGAVGLSSNVSNDTMVPSQEEHVESLGVRDRGKTWDSRTQDNNVSNDTATPSQADHADALGVSRPTIDTPSSNLL